MLDLSICICPACSGGLKNSGNDVRCTSCFAVFNVWDGIPILLTDPEQDTALDLDLYEVEHPFNPAHAKKVFSFYEREFDRARVTGGSCLEIGSGTGHITYALANESAFSSVHCSDVSAKFLAKLRKNLGPSDRLKYWIFDAGKLPFRSESMDAVIGHSVLHHLLHYESALKEVFRVLKPGGVAVFAEPIMDYYAVTSLLAGLICDFEEKQKIAGFEASELSLLRAISRSYAVCGQRMRDNREELTNVEDKHIFSITHLQDVGRQAGFSEIRYINAHMPPAIGADHKYRIQQVFRSHGTNTSSLDAYDFVFRLVTETYGFCLGPNAPYSFGFFAFCR